MSEHRVNPELLHRTAWGNPVWNALQSLKSMAFAWWQVLWPVLSGHLHYRHVCCSH